MWRGDLCNAACQNTVGKIIYCLPIVINVPTRGSLAVETKGSFVPVVGTSMLVIRSSLYIDELLIHNSSELPSVY